MSDTVQEVNERWKLKNGSVVIITHRLGPDAAGHFADNPTAHMTWTNGRATNGSGYDLAEYLEREA